jgi:DNA-binding Lrp family transcriptional regulator
MPTAVVLLNVEGQETTRIAESIASLTGVTEVYSVAGNYDLVAIIRVAANEELADLVTDRIRAIPGILASQTLIAFRTYSPSEVNAMFDMD